MNTQHPFCFDSYEAGTCFALQSLESIPRSFEAIQMTYLLVSNESCGGFQAHNAPIVMPATAGNAANALLGASSKIPKAPTD